MEDKDILRSYQARKEDAIRKTAEKYGTRCLNIAKNILSDARDAEECVNDAYLAVWNRIPPEEPRHFGAYLMGIIRNIALGRFDYNTAACRNPEYDLILDELAEVIADEDEQTVEADGLMDAINRFLNRETTKNRIIFVRRYFYNDSVREIGKRVDLKENAVRASLFRTRKKLAIYLKKQELGGIYLEKNEIIQTDE